MPFASSGALNSPLLTVLTVLDNCAVHRCSVSINLRCVLLMTKQEMITNQLLLLIFPSTLAQIETVKPFSVISDIKVVF